MYSLLLGFLISFVMNTVSSEELFRKEVYDFDSLDCLFVFINWYFIHIIPQQIFVMLDLDGFNLYKLCPDSIFYKCLVLLLHFIFLTYCLTFFEVITFIIHFYFYSVIISSYFAFKLRVFWGKFFKLLKIYKLKIIPVILLGVSLLPKLFYLRIRVLSKSIKIYFDINTYSLMYYYYICKNVEFFTYDVLYGSTRRIIRFLRFQRRLLCIFLFFYYLFFKGFFFNYLVIDLKLTFDLVCIFLLFVALFISAVYLQLLLHGLSKYLSLSFHYFIIKFVWMMCVCFYIVYVIFCDLNAFSFSTNTFIKDFIFKVLFFSPSFLLGYLQL